ncbi:SGNH/GDSL hydrolase family protein [Heyndrickxia oleronia]|uniref:SGNH/GDSL hydrolase family protein n=1 Tax=Heyndrickxia oleronia TaxID=38875 RepID=UPI0024307A90|nr:SGNH/GDSL hydrolase family protein [Heyndrickxia oleronia]MCI1590673.1 SGNH/GDSL hydrolase family protein [Heyndrickxia oleronia]MCI1612138.1 SGNH/GDSL hydrolase family protein [Heyndrickxia oleronia]MCI1759847.1 SGNH/GDSL hydrolase family protein [Heyndrickxia oleronia]
MNKFILLVIGLICFCVLVLGYKNWISKSTAAGNEGKIILAKIEQKENENRENQIISLSIENNKTQPLIDFLRYKALTNDKAIVSIIGSNLVAGIGTSNTLNVWPELLKRKLISEYDELESLEIIQHGYDGYSTSDFLKGKKIDLVIKDNPDLVIFENSIINNYKQAITLEQTNNDIKNIISQLKKALPNAKIIIMSSNPIVNSKNMNSLNLNYLNYLKESDEMIKKNNWMYINTYLEMENKLKLKDLLLVDILTNDYFHPNDNGHSLIFEIMYENLIK